jgi:hypothetical protein
VIFFTFKTPPAIAQLAERRTVDLKDKVILRSLVQIRFVGFLFFALVFKRLIEQDSIVSVLIRIRNFLRKVIIREKRAKLSFRTF